LYGTLTPPIQPPHRVGRARARTHSDTVSPHIGMRHTQCQRARGPRRNQSHSPLPPHLRLPSLSSLTHADACTHAPQSVDTGTECCGHPASSSPPITPHLSHAPTAIHASLLRQPLDPAITNGREEAAALPPARVLRVEPQLERPVLLPRRLLVPAAARERLEQLRRLLRRRLREGAV